MSLMLFGQAEPEPLPEEPAHSHRRRYLVILGMVVALILAGGSAAYLILNSSVSVNHGPPGALPPPGAGSPTPTVEDSGASTSASAGASANASASRGASPGHTPSGRPPGGGGGDPGAQGPATYRVASGELCPSVDFTAIHSKIGNGEPGSDHSDNPTSHYTDYMCTGTFAGKVKVQIDAFVFASAGDALASYASDRRGDHIAGVGSDAAGFTSTDGHQFWLYAVDGNLKIKIYQNSTDGKVPPATLRDVAVTTATGTMPRLRG